MDELIWQEHTFLLEKQPGVGFGIAVSGGRDNPGQASGDTSIIISDVVKVGPAFDRVKVNDIVLRVNGKPMFNMSHQQAVRELKNSGSRVELTIKRKVMVRVGRETPPPGPLRRSRSRDLDTMGRRHRSRSHASYRSRSSSRHRPRHRSRSRDLDSSPRHRRRHRSRSRDLSRSRSRTPPRSTRRGRSYSRSPSHHSSHHRRRSPSIDSRSPSPPPQRRGRSRSRTPPRRRSTSRSWSRSPSEHSAPRRDVTPPRANPPRHKSTEHLVRPSSPLSPDPDSATSDGDMMVFPVKNREPSTVVLKKTRWNNSYGLKLGTRIFIQDIQPGSLADKSSEISAGDTILMINGRNVDNKSVQEAIQIIGLSKDKVTMLVKKQDGGTVSIPADRFRTGAQDADPPATSGGAKVETESDGDSFDESEPPSRRSSVSKHSAKHSTKPPTPEPQPVAPKRGAGEKKQFGGVRVLPSGAAAPGAPSVSSHSSRDTPKQSSVKGGETREYAEPPADDDDDDDEPGPAVLPPTAREIEFAKAKNVGIRLAGGNDVGIFVASVLESSAAAKKGLKMGDQILSVNGVNFRNIIREEAVLTLMGLPTGEFVHIVAQPQPKVYQKILEHGTGDSFYIRTHFKYERNGDHEMSFKQGSTFRISDTLYQGMVGYWLAARIGRNNMEIERGVIPNRSRAEQLKMVQDRKMTQMRERNRGGIGRRIMKNQKTEGNLSTSSASSMFPAYERVVLREAGFKRPVVVFGPLADIARERLAGDHSDLYEVARNEGMVSGQKSNRKGVIRLNTIKDIIEKDKHAILDITPTAVEKLNYAQLYPIVVFLEPQSKSAVKELRQRLACTDEEKKKKPGKLFDRAVKMQRGYNHVFTDTIQLAAGSDDWYRRLYSTIKDQQSMPVWVSEDKLGGTGEEDTEGVTVPGDDDQFSYVSAPASDYSVTTAGSDFLNSSMRSEDDVTKPRDNPEVVPRQSAAESSEEEEDGGTAFKDDDFDDALDGLEDEPPLDKPVPPHLPAAESPLPLAPPREKKLSRPATSSSSSEDSEEEPPVEAPPVIVPKPSGQRPIRGKQEIPPGRFDPQSFLKNHIQALNKIPRESPQPQQESPPAPRVVEAAQQQAPPPRQPSPEPPRPEPQVAPTPTAAVEPVYAQVNKNRPQPSGHTASPGGRDYAGEIDSFISSDPYRNRPHPSRTQPLNEEPPSRYTNKPAQPYNRFAGISQPKPYNSGRPQGYQPVSNGPTSQQPPKSKFVQEKYKDYMSQIKPSSSGYPRPYSKPGAPPAGAAPVMNRNGGLKENMYDSGVDTYDNAKPKKQEPPPPANPAPADPVDDEDPQVVATARGVFDSNGGVLSSVETGVSIVIPKGAIRPGVRQEIYFKVCRDNTALPPLDKDKGETLLSPLVMCGPHGLQFDHPVELRLPHCEPSQWQNVNQPGGDNYDVGSNSVSVLIDHF